MKLVTIVFFFLFIYVINFFNCEINKNENANISDEKEIPRDCKLTEEKLKKCLVNNETDATVYKKEIDNININLSTCVENEKKRYKEMNLLSSKFNECINAKESEKTQSKNKIKKLENVIRNLEYKVSILEKQDETNSDDNIHTCKSIDHNKNNYLISYDIFKNNLFKIYKIYKTFYIILVEKTNIFNVKNEMLVYKNLTINFIKTNGLLLHEKLFLYYKVLLKYKHLQVCLKALRNIQTNKYVVLLKNQIFGTVLTVKSILESFIIKMKQYLELFKSNVGEHLEFFFQKLQNNSEFMLNYLHSVNPDVKGIIPQKLLDQVILLIFFTAVNVIHLYIFFYLFFIIFKCSKGILCFLLRWIYFIISFIFKVLCFFITIPIRPFIKKKKNKNRKVYKKHEENPYNNHERANYQQNEFKRTNKNQHIKQRKY